MLNSILSNKLHRVIEAVLLVQPDNACRDRYAKLILLRVSELYCIFCFWALLSDTCLADVNIVDFFYVYFVDFGDELELLLS